MMMRQHAAHLTELREARQRTDAERAAVANGVEWADLERVAQKAGLYPRLLADGKVELGLRGDVRTMRAVVNAWIAEKGADDGDEA